jgi:hypothetical protein
VLNDWARGFDVFQSEEQHQLTNDRDDLSVALTLIDRLAQTKRALVRATGKTRQEILEDMEACAYLLKLTLQPLVKSEATDSTLTQVLH